MNFTLKVVLLLSFAYFSTQKDMSIFLQRCTSFCNEKYCKIHLLCRPLNGTSKLTKFDLHLHPGIILNAPIYIEFNANKKFRTIYRPFMVKLKIEVCEEFLQRTHPVFRLIGNLTDGRNGNLLEPCPISGHKFLGEDITNSNFDHKWPLFPVGEWRLDYILSTNINGSSEHIASASTFYEIKPTGAKEF